MRHREGPAACSVACEGVIPVSSNDFRQIAASGEIGKSERLFRAAISAFCSLTRPTQREIAQLEDLTLPLFDSVSPEGLRFVAAALSECEFAPRALVRRLADEPVAVSAPILMRSAMLSDIDLISLIGRHGVSHARAIARRASLNPTIDNLIHALLESAGRQTAAAAEARAEPALPLAPPTFHYDLGMVETIEPRLPDLMPELPSNAATATKIADDDFLPHRDLDALLALTANNFAALEKDADGDPAGIRRASASDSDDRDDEDEDDGAPEAAANDVSPLSAPLREESAAELIPSFEPVRRSFGKADAVRDKLRAMMRPVRPEHDVLELPPLLDSVEVARLRDTALTGNPAFFQTALADTLGIDFMQARVIAGGQAYTDLSFALKSLEVAEEQAFVIVAAVYPAAFGHAEAIRLFLDRYRLCHPEAARDRLRDWKAESIAGTVRRAKPKLRQQSPEDVANSDAPRPAILKAS